MTRVLITGSREFTDRSIIAAALTQVWRENGKQSLTVVTGNARGADQLAETICATYPGRLVNESYPADWRPGGVYNGNAGTERNNLMVSFGADVCLAFLKEGAKNIGTRHCIGAASRAGIPVRQFWQTS